MKTAKQFWEFLKKDTWQSWIVSMLLIVIFIKFIFFPTISFVTNSPLPLVVVESCSRYHGNSFENWWKQNQDKYENLEIEKEKFEEFKFKNGLTKGDIIFIWGRGEYKEGDIIIFNAVGQYAHPIIHRMISTNPIETIGDNGITNPQQAPFEKNIQEQTILGKSVIKIPLIGWVKLIFFEPFRESYDRGTCGMQMAKLQ